MPDKRELNNYYSQGVLEIIYTLNFRAKNDDFGAINQSTDIML